MKDGLIAVVLLAALLFVLAVGGSGMMGYGGMMGGYGMAGFGVIGMIYVALVSFVFSAVFWMTYKWIVKENGEKKK